MLSNLAQHTIANAGRIPRLNRLMRPRQAFTMGCRRRQIECGLSTATTFIIRRSDLVAQNDASEAEATQVGPSESISSEPVTPDPARESVPALTGTEGIVYLLENEAFEAPVIKIGRTGRDLAERIRTLNTSVPLPFTCYRASRVSDAVKVEKLLHDVFQPAKKHWRGEFYEVEPWRVVLVLSQYEIENLTHLAPRPDKDDEDSIGTTVQQKDRKTTFTFAMLGIEVGEKLELVGDPEVKCIVANDQTGVTYEEQEYALSTLATQLKGSSHWLQGLRYWSYGGETLLKRRDRILDAQIHS